MTIQAAEFLKPLIEIQPYINELTISDNIPDKCINLDDFRKLRLNLGSGDIRRWYFNLTRCTFKLSTR